MIQVGHAQNDHSYARPLYKREAAILHTSWCGLEIGIVHRKSYGVILYRIRGGGDVGEQFILIWSQSAVCAFRDNMNEFFSLEVLWSELVDFLDKGIDQIDFRKQVCELWYRSRLVPRPKMATGLLIMPSAHTNATLLLMLNCVLEIFP